VLAYHAASYDDTALCAALKQRDVSERDESYRHFVRGGLSPRP
jgi:hypothetical protein